MSERLGTVYGIRDREGSVIYVGQTRNSLRARWRNHVNGKTSISHALRFFGPEDFEIFPIETAPESALNEREEFWIAKLRTTHPNGLNYMAGGNASARSAATRARMSEAKKRACADPDYRAKLAKRAQALWSSEEGRAKKRASWTVEARARVSAQSKLLASDPAHIRKVSEGTLRAFTRPEVRENLRSAQKSRWADPIARERQSERLKAVWAKKRDAACS
jgi:hypothetical protein